MILRTSGSGVARRLQYESPVELDVYDIVTLDDRLALVVDIEESDAGGAVLHCQRLWRLRLNDASGDPVGSGFIVNEQRHHGDVDTLILEAGERFRLLYAESEWPPDFDGALVVERV